MVRHAPNSEFQISARLLQPFVKLLAECSEVSASQLNHFRTLSLDDRIPVERSYQLLEAAIALTGDDKLGLKAGRLVDQGAGGPFEYAIRSARTVEAAIEVASRFMRLLNDGLEFRLLVEGERARVVLENKLETPRAAADFQASALHSAYLTPHLGDMPGLEWSFPYPAPEDLTEYEAIFAPAVLRFDAPYLGYSFEKNYLTSRRETGDPRLHTILKKYAEVLLSELPKHRNLTRTVRAMIEEDLGTSRPAARVVAQRLGVSQRTLSRRLEAEGTSFKELLDECRRALALDYLTRPVYRLQQTVLLLGFSETATFYRAFKRWTGQTPLRYRRASRGDGSKPAEARVSTHG